MPSNMVSDRDPIFLNHFWQELFRLSGSKLITAYHPQSETEIVNKAVQQYLRCFVHEEPKRWGQFLHWAEWQYNTSIHSTTGFIRFEIVYGRPPPSLITYIEGASHIQAVDDELYTRSETLDLVKKKLLKAQETMKLYADKKRSPHQFNEKGGHKLTKSFFGPFKLIQQIDDVAFKLELPETSRIHPVFHISKLKPCKGSTEIQFPLPPDSVDNMPLVKPLAILDWKEVEGIRKLLIQWEGLFSEYATWESLEEMLQVYPELHLEDKVCVSKIQGM
ncbi:hypothetical protein A2U01_0001919 [Trifolium medium]|uniref:Tf2-1-like SH3-like domain-containing protein n=1 Tax=Trifolium medium TaxID=97028 RepID=A0A392M2B7_9FABA|nr:hypothetical protein [Trifolium medium]